MITELINMRIPFSLTNTLLLFLGPIVATARADVPARGNGPFTIGTFHCLGIYWSPPGGSRRKDVQVSYRQQGTSEWKEALPMRYNPIPGTDEDLTDYRGSIVHLTPGTTYESPARPGRNDHNCPPDGPDLE